MKKKLIFYTIISTFAYGSLATHSSVFASDQNEVTYEKGNPAKTLKALDVTFNPLSLLKGRETQYCEEGNPANTHLKALEEKFNSLYLFEGRETEFVVASMLAHKDHKAIIEKWDDTRASMLIDLQQMDDDTIARFGDELLQIMARWGFTELVDCLIARNAGLYHKAGYFGYTPLHSLITGYEQPLLEIETDIEDEEFKKIHEGRIVHLAQPYIPRENVLASIQNLIQAMENLETPDTFGSTALSLAAGINSAPITKMLIEAGASVHSQGSQKRTPLIRAVNANKTENTNAHNTVRVLLEAGADPNTKDICGSSALAIAAETKWAHMTKILIDAGANVDSQDDSERTPLIRAVTAKANEIANANETAEILLTAGANPNIKDINGRSALVIGTLSNNIGLVNYMVNGKSENE